MQITIFDEINFDQIKLKTKTSFEGLMVMRPLKSAAVTVMIKSGNILTFLKPKLKKSFINQ